MRKVFISFLALLTIFISSVSIPQKTQAAAPVLSRVVGGSVGERIIIGIGEKAGIKYTSKKATQEAVERWNLEIYEKIQEAERYGRELEAEDYRKLQEMLKSKKVEDLEKVDTGSKNNPGIYGKAVISTAMFLTGLDIIIDLRQEYVDAVNNNKLLEKVQDYEELIEEGEAFTSYGPYTFFTEDWGADKTDIGFGLSGAPDQYPLPKHYVALTKTNNPFTGIVTKVITDSKTGYLNVSIALTYIDYSYKQTTELTKTLVLPALGKLITPNGDIVPDYNKVNFQPDPSHIPSVPSVPWVSPWRDNPETDKPILPDTIPIEVPLEDPDIYNPGQPWNDPLPEYEPVTNPEPGDQPDKDYIPGIPVNPTPGTNPDTGTNPEPGGETNPNPESPTVPDPGGNTEPVSPTTPGTPGTPTPDPPGNGKDGPVKTDPLSWIWIFIKFLIAIIMFLLRLAKFIVTIPLVPAEQFPGVYGEMVATFMNLKYGNIYPYKIMISVVNLAFGFVVYKMLRRVFNG